ncbi:hypothetical protein [Streptomyces poriticola]|uniref:hypothetical protein n=1 Tax=Streptomyces poriticola TaxID=3120506 RepID=UPI002FCE517A
MNGNPLYHWTALAVATVLVVPVSAAVLAGWSPRWSRNRRQAGMRLRACGFLCCYALTLVNAVPRIADASYGTVMACTSVGFGFIGAAAALFMLAERKDSRAGSTAGLAATCGGPTKAEKR